MPDSTRRCGTAAGQGIAMRFVSGMAVATMLVGVLSAATTSPARAASSYSYGKYWAAATSADNERLETGPAARAFGDAMSAVGYANTTDLDGETANQGWLNGANAQVFGFFGHADFDRLALDDPAPGSSDPNTIQWHWANLSTWEVDLAPNVRSWEEYQPGLADDMKFAILGGCHTAANPDDGNSWFLILRLIGVDNVAGFSDFVFGPTVEGDPSSGNYYWTRFSDYARNGYTLRDALSLARADLFTAEGNNWGFDSWAVGGANDDPGAARFTPAEAGAPNVAGTGSVFAPVTPVPTPALDLGGLTVTRSRSTTVDGQRVIDRETAEGVTYRLDGDGDLAAF